VAAWGITIRKSGALLLLFFGRGPERKEDLPKEGMATQIACKHAVIRQEKGSRK